MVKTYRFYKNLDLCEEGKGKPRSHKEEDNERREGRWRRQWEEEEDDGYLGKTIEIRGRKRNHMEKWKRKMKLKKKIEKNEKETDKNNWEK